MTAPPAPEDYGLTAKDLRHAVTVTNIQRKLQEYGCYVFRLGFPVIILASGLTGGYPKIGASDLIGIAAIFFFIGIVLDQTLGRGLLVTFLGSRHFRALLMKPEMVRYEASLNAARAELKRREEREARERERGEERRRKVAEERRRQEEAKRQREADAAEQRRKEAAELERQRNEEARRQAEQRARAEAERERRDKERRRQQAELDRIRRKDAWLKMDGYQFENAVADLFEAAGWQVERRGKSGDNGVDLTIKHQGSELRTIVQCKAHKSRISKDTLRALQGVREDFEYAPAIIACLHGPTQGGIDYANRKGIQVFDVDALVDFARGLHV